MHDAHNQIAKLRKKEELHLYNSSFYILLVLYILLVPEQTVVDNTTNWSETSFLQTLDYSARDKARQEAQSWFDSQTAILSREEKVIEIKKKSADTEYQAATTEYESVKQLISDNSERSFSIWS